MAYVFPSDLLGSDEYGHAIVFKAYEARSDVPGAAYDTIINNLPGAISQFAPSNPFNSPLVLQDQFILYVPGGGQNTLTYQQVHEYDEVKLSRLGVGIMSSIIGTGGGGAGSDAVTTGLVLFRRAINPKIEVLFRSTELRNFNFSFLFAPQSKPESDSLKEMLKAFRHYAAPEISDALLTSDGLLFKSPSEWRIDFMYKKNNGTWTKNEYLPRIAKSVCTRIDVDYNPDTEFSSFENGDPVSARLTMQFVEMEIIDKKRISEGY